MKFSTSNVLTVTDSGDNVIIGGSAGNASLSGTANTGLGFASLNALTSGADNIGIGYASIDGITTGSYNIAIGSNAGTSYTGSESSNILFNSTGTVGESNVLRIGAANGTTLQALAKTFIQGISGVTVTGTAVLCSTGGQLGTISSSIRYKENVKDMLDSVSVMDLRPVEFNYIKDEKKEKHYGLIAEEVHKDFPYLCFYNDSGEPESVLYHELPVFLLKEIQKIKKELLSLSDIRSKTPRK